MSLVENKEYCAEDLEKLDLLVEKMIYSFEYICKVAEKLEFYVDNDEYKKLNKTYYYIITTHQKALLMLINNKYPKYTSSLILARTIIELFVKSFYCQIILKSKNKEVDEIISEKAFKKIKFVDMLKELDDYKDSKTNKTFGGFFIEFFKIKLGTYEKLSYFSHGKGEYFKYLYDSDCKKKLHPKSLFEILHTIHVCFICLTVFHLVAFGHKQEAKNIILKFKDELESEAI